MTRIKELKKNLQYAKTELKSCLQRLGENRMSWDDPVDCINLKNDVAYWKRRCQLLEDEIATLQKAHENTKELENGDVITCGRKVLVHFDDERGDLIVMLSDSPISEQGNDFAVATKNSPLGELLFGKPIGFSGTYSVKDRLGIAETFHVSVIKFL